MTMQYSPISLLRKSVRGDMVPSKSYRPISRRKSLWLTLNGRHQTCSRTATDAIPLPEPKPRAVREHFVVPSVGSRDVACAERPNIRRFEHFLLLLDVVNDAFNFHASRSSRRKRGAVNLKRHWFFVSHSCGQSIRQRPL